MDSLMRFYGKSLTWLILGLLTLLILTACSPSPQPVNATPTAEAATRTPLPSITPLPSETPLPSNTPLPSATPTVTLTPTVTPDPALAEVDLLGLSWLEHYDMMVTLQFPEPVTPEQYRVKVEDKEYACQQLTGFPNRLYCIGQGLNVYRRVTIQVYQQNSEQPGFVGQISVPFFP